MEKNIKDKVVMVTGAGESIDSEFFRQNIKYQPSLLVLFEASEYSLYRIERELVHLPFQAHIVPIIGNVQNQNRLTQTMTAYDVNMVYHAAA